MILILFLLISSIICFILSSLIKKNTNKIKKKNQIQKGKIKYTDLSRPAKALFSKKYNIAGKPDYVTKIKDKYIPIEFKSTIHNHPNKNHILQLAAYCHLIEENYNIFVPYGILVYSNSKFNINFDPKLRFELEDSIKKIRSAIKTGKIIRNHHDKNRCKYCSLRSKCEYKLI